MVHLLGEEDFSFATCGGQIKVRRSDTILTPFGGFVAFSSFIERLGIIDTLVESGTLFEICQYEYCAYVTDLTRTYANALQIVILYNQRCDGDDYKGTTV